MTTKKIVGVVCCILAALLAVVAIKNSFITPEISVSDESGLGVSRLVGAFLPSVLVLALGLWLFQKPKSPGNS